MNSFGPVCVKAADVPPTKTFVIVPKAPPVTVIVFPPA